MAVTRFTSLYQPGARVTEVAAPKRKGRVVTARGRGPHAVIWVQLDGRGVVSFRPGQMTLGG